MQKMPPPLLVPKAFFDLKSFHEMGGSVIGLSEQDVQDFEMIYDYAIEWEEDPDGIFFRVPKGVRPTEEDFCALVENKLDANVRSNFMNSLTLDRTAPVLKEKIRNLLKGEHFYDFTRTYDLEVPFVDLWCGSEGCSWHWDGVECTHFLVLVYMTEHDLWKESFGGQLLVGRRLDGGDYQSHPTDETVEALGVIEPRNGTMVIVNNHNPYLVHKCNLIAKEAGKRVTLTFGVKIHKKDVMSSEASVSFSNER